jgi:hypothetical protein
MDMRFGTWNVRGMYRSRSLRAGGEQISEYKILVEKPEGKRPLGRPRSRRVYNIKINLRETEWEGMDWVDLSQDRDQWMALVNMVMGLRLP